MFKGEFRTIGDPKAIDLGEKSGDVKDGLEIGYDDLDESSEVSLLLNSFSIIKWKTINQF